MTKSYYDGKIVDAGDGSVKIGAGTMCHSDDKDWFRPGAPVFTNPVYESPSPEQQKHEEIKRMAWEIYQKMYIAGLNNNQAYAKHLPIIRQAAWDRAEEFHDFAKQKEGKVNDE